MNYGKLTEPSGKKQVNLTFWTKSRTLMIIESGNVLDS
jgi:hypothetical protein